ncbi:MAG TPA: ATP-binding protein [Rhodocyclaceae bacterium]
MFSSQLKPEQVFTPRSAEVNPEMYVPRPALEKALKLALRGNLHIIIHGESGTGKSWLYKKTFRDSGVQFLVANLANASRLGSISAELKNLIDREGDAVKTGYEEEKSAEVSALLAKGELSHTGQYDIGQMEPFEAALRFLRNKAGSNTAVLVFDNLEAAFTEPLLKELADLVILCDDERYSKYAIKILIVGVPSGIKEYFYKTPHHSTVANRLTELPEVARMERDECFSLVSRGLIEKLRYEVPEIDKVARHVSWITDRIPQMVHEYCLELAFLGEETRSLGQENASAADVAWLSKSQYFAYSAIESHMNERDTKAGRRNQTLYALSLCDGEEFRAPEIEAFVRAEFPTSTDDTALNVPQMMSQLSSGERPIVRRSPKGDAFAFADPRYRMVLRTMLNKTADERVERLPVSKR